MVTYLRPFRSSNSFPKLRRRRQMTKRQGSTNYSSGEMEHLLALVRQHLPATKPEWIDVSAAYNATKEPQWKRRSAVSLKRKFRSMGLPSKRGDSRWSAATRCAQTMMKQQRQRAMERRITKTPPSQVQRPSSELPAVRDGFVEPRSTGSSLPARSTQSCLPAALHSTDEVKQLLSSLQEHFVLHPPSEGRDASSLKELPLQRKSDRRAARRHHKELLQSMALMKVTLESLFACWD
ncbi:hypothetical protein PR001_g26949 [Phytophthora rubi]|uniref:DUF6818 domain-containing protein n=1 Tax=Phytophthora rubi TaxID=129364 RepID=A0A6A3HNM2_9STRA|nr:hypothetical protein PR001_g26949 [Phytophthora rubi]